MKIGYLRTTQKDNFYKEQRDILLAESCERIFEDIGEDNLNELNHLLDYIRPEDKVHITQMDRLGLNVSDLMKFVAELLQRNIHIKSIEEGIDTTTNEGRIFLKIFNALSLCEQNAVHDNFELQNTTSDIDKSNNITTFPCDLNKELPLRIGGRPKGLTSHAKEKAVAAARMYKNSALSMREIANNLNISTATLYSYLRHEKIID